MGITRTVVESGDMVQSARSALRVPDQRQGYVVGPKAGKISFDENGRTLINAKRSEDKSFSDVKWNSMGSCSNV